MLRLSENILDFKIVNKIHHANSYCVKVGRGKRIAKVIEEVELSIQVVCTNRSFPDYPHFTTWQKLPVVLHVYVKLVEVAVVKWLSCSRVGSGIINVLQSIVFCKFKEIVVFNPAPVVSHSKGDSHAIGKDVAGG